MTVDFYDYHDQLLRAIIISLPVVGPVPSLSLGIYTYSHTGTEGDARIVFFGNPRRYHQEGFATSRGVGRLPPA